MVRKDIVSDMVQERLLQMTEEKQKSTEEEDIISRVIGEFGKWQLLLTFLLSLVNIPCTFHIFGPTFQAVDRDVWCARPASLKDVAPILWKNCTQPSGDICNIYDVVSANLTAFCNHSQQMKIVKCDSWEFEGPGETLISEFNLICDRKWLKNLAEMMFLAGVPVGGLICGILSDKYGRKRTLIASLLIQSTLGTAIAFAPWFELYIVLRAALGFISVSVVFSSFVLVIELVGGHWRTISGISNLFPVSVGYIAIAGLGYWLPDWRKLQLAISLPGFLLLLALWWLVPESPRWLLALGHTDEVMVILKKAAKTNNKELPANLDKQLRPAGLEDGETEHVSVMDLFKTPQMRKKTLVLFFIWFSVYLVYYGLVLNLGNIGGNLYVNSILIGVVEVPALVISILILVKGGRRWPMALTMIISGVSVLFTIPISVASPNLQWLITSFTMMSKFSISSSNAIMPVYTAELYPTTIRNIGVGAANVTAGIALMLVPYLWELKNIHESIPMSMIAIFGILGGLSVLFLPETGSGPLLDTLKEEEEVTSETINNNRRT